MSSALAEAFVAEELSLIQSLDAPTPREISGLVGRGVEFETDLADASSAGTSRDRLRMTVFLGFLLGVLVSLTSIGVGAIGIVVLRHLYPRLSAVRLVGSDIAHAAPLTLLAGSGHWLMGDVKPVASPRTCRNAF